MRKLNMTTVAMAIEATMQTWSLSKTKIQESNSKEHSTGTELVTNLTRATP